MQHELAVLTLFENDDVWLSDEATIPAKLSNLQVKDCIMLVIVNSMPLSDIDNNLILNMMSACRLSESQYMVMDVSGDWQSVLNQVTNVLIFGVPPQQLGLGFALSPEYPVIIDGKYWILTRPAAQVAADKQLKKALWLNCLKPRFDK